MFSILETIEQGAVCVTATSSKRIAGNILYWPPPGSSVDRSEHTSPGPDWIPQMCKVLKDKIETFEEALVLEKRYSKHRDSNSFREEQERKKLKRLHPVNYADQSDSDLIDVNALVKKIKGGAEEATESNTLNLDAGRSTQTSKYHNKCMANKLINHNSGAMKQSVAKTTNSSVKLRTKTVKKPVKKLLPFQRQYLKTSRVNNRSPVPVVIKPKCPRYDNFLKSGNRFVTSQVKTKSVPSATITKQQYLQQVGRTSEIDLDDRDEVPAPENYGHTSTPIETEEKTLRESCVTANKTEETSYVAQSHSMAKKSNIENETLHYGELDNEVVQTTTPASSQGYLTFEERVLKEFGNLKESQKLFETRMERRIENFINEQPQIQVNEQRRIKSTYQSQKPSNYRQSRQYGLARNLTQTRFREPDFPEYDFDEFEELDKKFPIDILENVPDLEFTIRKDLEFNFLLKARLNELTGRDYKKCIRLKMKYLVVDEVLERYTWRGTEEKSSFRKLKALNALLLSSVRSQFPKCKYDEYKDYMVQWVKHAKTRQRIVTYTYPEPGGRKKKLGGSRDEDDSSYDEDDGDGGRS